MRPRVLGILILSIGLAATLPPDHATADSASSADELILMDLSDEDTHAVAEALERQVIHRRMRAERKSERRRAEEERRARQKHSRRR
jgi:hypothetical protein